MRIEVATTRWIDGRHAVVTGIGVRCGKDDVSIVGLEVTDGDS